jgi:hypothetical protein
MNKQIVRLEDGRCACPVCESFIDHLHITCTRVWEGTCDTDGKDRDVSEGENDEVYSCPNCFRQLYL